VKAREETAEDLSTSSQNELEASDDVKEMQTRKNIFKEALEHYTELDDEAIKRIEFLKGEEAKAAMMLSQSNDKKKTECLQGNSDFFS
jgi:hypothetical protein